MPNPYAYDLNGLSFERLIEFVKVDLTVFGGSVLRFCNSSTFQEGLPELSHVTWEGNTWLAVPFQSGGFQRGGESGASPAVQIADFTGELYTLMRGLPALGAGAPVVRYLAFAEDVENEIPFASFREEHYILNSPSHTDGILELELKTHLDFGLLKFPGYVMFREDFPGLGSAIQRR